MKIKMIVTDIDGTLVNDDRQITTRTINTLKMARKQGIYVVLCTGRPVSGIEENLAKLDLRSDDDYAITFNGAQARNIGTNEIVFQNGITAQNYMELFEMSKKLGIKGQLVTSDSQLYVADQDISQYSVQDAFYTKMSFHYRPLDAMPQNLEGMKFMWVDDLMKIKQATPKIPTKIQNKYYSVLSAPYFLEFTNPNATKGHAVLELAEKLNILPTEIMTIGDENNDLTMLEAVDNSVAMGNARAEIKKITKYVTDDNNHDGVAKAVEKYAL